MRRMSVGSSSGYYKIRAVLNLEPSLIIDGQRGHHRRRVLTSDPARDPLPKSQT
jgi:hypothetical protein